MWTPPFPDLFLRQSLQRRKYWNKREKNIGSRFSNICNNDYWKQICRSPGTWAQSPSQFYLMATITLELRDNSEPTFNMTPLCLVCPSYTSLNFVFHHLIDWDLLRPIETYWDLLRPTETWSEHIGYTRQTHGLTDGYRSLICTGLRHCTIYSIIS